MIAFTFHAVGELVKSIMLMDGVTGEVRKFEDDRFDFDDTRTVFVLKELYAFKWGSPVTAYKIANFTSSENLVVTTLPTLPHEAEELMYFAVSYWAAAGSIVLTGGLDNVAHEPTAQTFLLTVQTGQWERRSFPALNIARHTHASMTLDKQAYVACGLGDGS